MSAAAFTTHDKRPAASDDIDPRRRFMRYRSTEHGFSLAVALYAVYSLIQPETSGTTLTLGCAEWQDLKELA